MQGRKCAKVLSKSLQKHFIALSIPHKWWLFFFPIVYNRKQIFIWKYIESSFWSYEIVIKYS